MTEPIKSLAWRLADEHGIHVRQLGFVLHREYGALLKGDDDGAWKALALAAALPFAVLHEMVHATKPEHPEHFE